MRHSFDINSYGEFFVHYYNELYAYANAILRDGALAEDMVQDIFLKYWENRHRIKLDKSLIAYFYTAVRNRCYNQLEHLSVERKGMTVITKNAESEHETSDESENNPRIEQMRQILDQLPLQCRRVVILSSIEGMKYREIAVEMSISVNTVKKHISRAYSFVRKTMPLKIFLSIIAG